MTLIIWNNFCGCIIKASRKPSAERTMVIWTLINPPPIPTLNTIAGMLIRSSKRLPIFWEFFNIIILNKPQDSLRTLEWTKLPAMVQHVGDSVAAWRWSGASSKVIFHLRYIISTTLLPHYLCIDSVIIYLTVKHMPNWNNTYFPLHSIL